MNMERFFKKEVLRLKNVCRELFNTYQSLFDKFVELNQENINLKQQIKKLKEFVKLAVELGFDCQSCRKIGIDSKKCSGDCVENIFNFLTKNG